MIKSLTIVKEPKICSTEGCEGSVIAHGVCMRCYQRNYQRRRTKTYRSWESMKQRCTNPKFSSFHWYGGRGVKICDRWSGEKGFKNFLSDMGEVPVGLTLERINNLGDYEPYNCRWATRKEQCRNRKTSAFITFDGKTQTIAAWAEELGTNPKTIYNRRYIGWNDEDSLFGR